MRENRRVPPPVTPPSQTGGNRINGLSSGGDAVNCTKRGTSFLQNHGMIGAFILHRNLEPLFSLDLLSIPPCNIPSVFPLAGA